MSPNPDETVAPGQPGVPNQKKIDSLYWWLALVLLIGGVTASWVNHFANAFHQDDKHLILQNPAVRTAAVGRIIGTARAAGDVPEFSSWRPLTTLSLALDYKILNGNPVIFHMDSFLWFAFMIAGIYLLSRALPGSGPYTALFSAALAALHPLMADNLNYVSQRYLIGRGSALAFATALFFCWPRRLPQQIWYVLPRVPKNDWDVLMRRTRTLIATSWKTLIGLPIPWYFVPLVFGLLADPGTAVFPLILIVWMKLFEPERPLRQVIPAGIVCGIWWLTHTVLMLGPAAPVRKPALGWWFTQFWVIARYVFDWVAPWNLSPVSDLRLLSPASLPALGGIVIVASIAALAWLAGRTTNGRIAAFGLWWFLITALPEFLVPQATVESLSRAIVPICGLGLAVAGLAWWLIVVSCKSETWRRPLVIATVAVALAMPAWLGIEAHERNRIWESEDSLWTEVLEHYPSHAEGLLNYGTMRIAAGDAEGGYQYLEKARASDPQSAEIQLNLGRYAESAAKTDSDDHYKKAIQLAPTSALVQASYSDWLLLKLRYKEALDTANRAVALDPMGIPGRTAVVNVYLATRGWTEALTFGRTTLELLPGDPDALRAVNVATGALDEQAAAEKRAKSDPSVDNYLQLSTVQMQNGRFEEGIAACRAAIKIDPRLAEAWSNMSVGYHMMGRTDESIAALREAIRLRPDLPNLKDNLEAELASKARQTGQPAPAKAK